MAKRRQRRIKGSGHIVAPTVSGGLWSVRCAVGKGADGKRITRTIGGLRSREEAEKVLDRVVGERASGRSLLPPDPKDSPTLDVLAKDFLERRKRTHRAADCDGYRWKKHMQPHFGHLRPGEVDIARIKAFVELKRTEGLNPATIRIFIAILSALFVDLVEDGIALVNPCRSLPRSTRRLMKPTHDPKTTPFIEKLEDVRRIFLVLPEPFNIAYALGALVGLRTGEVLALRWEHVDLGARRIHVRESTGGPLKDKDSRIAPILDPLLPILSAWKLKTGGVGRVVPPLRRDGEYLKKHTLYDRFREALTRLGLPELLWYEATRHTFASQWVLAGNSIEKLKEILGHYSVIVTERYAHLKPELFTQKDHSALSIDLRPAGSVATIETGSLYLDSSITKSETIEKKSKKVGAAL